MTISSILQPKIDFEQDLLKDSLQLQKLLETEITQNPIVPDGGFVIKTKVLEPTESLKSAKMFINLCHSKKLPINSMERYVEEIKNGTFKLPLSLSPIRTDLDKQGSLCYVVDAAINTTAYQLTLQDPDFKQFVVDLCTAWVSEKHRVELGQVTLPKMICKGKLVPHLINRPHRPAIEEVLPDLNISTNSEDRREVEILTKPNYTLIKEPDSGIVNLTVKIHLSKEENIDNMELDLEKDGGKCRLCLASKFYKLDLDLEYNVDIDLAGNRSNLTVGAQFDCLTRYLNVQMTVS